ncbi:MAG: glucosaminidase domain-containing protein [Saprospiraceae bacterium]|nr:glucosaminidase domain-containing protein [Saprospiraceae bacterium]
MKLVPPYYHTLRLFVLPFVLLLMVSARPVSVQEKYIEQFKFLAISEMDRSGIPASIKMAQGLLESMAGRSELAIQANNHFGIKCKNNWNGETYQYEDDDYNASGQLIASCFRSYSSAIDSYKDHSDFLMNRPRYKELFNLSKTDYIAWAYGLKRCGYATDPNYAERLIRTIQKYNLDLLDYKTEVKEELIVEPAKREIQTMESLQKKLIKPIFVSNPVKKSIPAKTIKGIQKKKRKSRI